MRIKVGDRIKFRTVTRWRGPQTVWRVVNDFDALHPDRPTVRYGQWPHFLVRPEQIIEVERREKRT